MYLHVFQRQFRIRFRYPRRYLPIFRDVTRWSLAGAVLTELTVNAHAYLVTFIAGPGAFALLALGMLLMRPASLMQSALTDLERPAMARAIGAKDGKALARIQRTPLICVVSQPRIADPVQVAGLNFPNRIGLAAGLEPGRDPAATPACVNACITSALAFGDVTDFDAMGRMVRDIEAEHGPIGILVNCAGITRFVAHANLEGVQAEDFLDVYRVNVVGPFQMARAVAPAMKAGHLARQASTQLLLPTSSLANRYRVRPLSSRSTPSFSMVGAALAAVQTLRASKASANTAV